MSTTQQAKARRRQAASGFMNLAPRVRPHYKKRSKEASAQHLARILENERRIRMGSKKKK
jgi:hypothetical protein